MHQRVMSERDQILRYMYVFAGKPLGKNAAIQPGSDADADPVLAPGLQQARHCEGSTIQTHGNHANDSQNYTLQGESQMQLRGHESA